MRANVSSLVAFALESIGADGLACEDEPCGCTIGDLAPCGHLIENNCVAAKKGPCNGSDYCKAGECDSHMYPIEDASQTLTFALVKLGRVDQ